MEKEFLTVKVERDDLNGYYDNTKDCPIARAINKLPVMEDANIYVYHDRVDVIYINRENISYRIRKKDNDKAYSRSRGLWGRIIGGFTIVLEKT